MKWWANFTFQRSDSCEKSLTGNGGGTGLGWCVGFGVASAGDSRSAVGCNYTVKMLILYFWTNANEAGARRVCSGCDRLRAQACLCAGRCFPGRGDPRHRHSCRGHSRPACEVFPLPAVAAAPRDTCVWGAAGVRAPGRLPGLPRAWMGRFACRERPQRSGQRGRAGQGRGRPAQPSPPRARCQCEAGRAPQTLPPPPPPPARRRQRQQRHRWGPAAAAARRERGRCRCCSCCCPRRAAPPRWPCPVSAPRAFPFPVCAPGRCPVNAPRPFPCTLSAARSPQPRTAAPPAGHRAVSAFLSRPAAKGRGAGPVPVGGAAVAGPCPARGGRCSQGAWAPRVLPMPLSRRFPLSWELGDPGPGHLGSGVWTACAADEAAFTLPGICPGILPAPPPAKLKAAMFAHNPVPPGSLFCSGYCRCKGKSRSLCLRIFPVPTDFSCPSFPRLCIHWRCGFLLRFFTACCTSQKGGVKITQLSCRPAVGTRSGWCLCVLA